MRLLSEKDGYRIYSDSSQKSGTEFYARIGHVLVDRQIRKELGGPLNSSDDYIWLLTYDSKMHLVAFSSLNLEHLEKRGEGWFDNAYVFPEHRQHGLHRHMFELRLELARQCGVRVLKGLATPASRAVFEAYGFEIASTRGQYRVYRKDLSNDNVRRGDSTAHDGIVRTAGVADA